MTTRDTATTDTATTDTAQAPGDDAAEYSFDLSGGAPCLDFVNTVSDRSTEPIEHLTGYPRLVAWARQAGQIDGATATRLEAVAADRPLAAQEVLDRARRLREALFALFAAAAAGRRADGDGLAAINAELPLATARRRLARDGDGYRLADDPDAEPALDAPLAPVVRSAVELLTSDELDRVRECAADTCRWLFLDHSRNHSRRWCDMKVCGNRAKVRRHYRRQRAVGTAGP